MVPRRRQFTNMKGYIMWMLVLVTVIGMEKPIASEIKTFDSEKSCHIAMAKYENKKFTADNQEVVCVMAAPSKPKPKDNSKNSK